MSFLTRKNQHYQALQDSGINALLLESRRLLEESKTKDLLGIVKPATAFSPEIKEIFENLSAVFQSYQSRMSYNIMKYQLANNALHTGLWDMDVVDGDPVNPNNTFIWTDEFRRMLGFTNASEFPNKLSSWSDRLHPDDKERTLNAFARHMTDRSGRTPYDVKYKIKLKNGEYGYFRATGDTVRDSNGVPLRVAGLLLDLAHEKKAEELDRQLAEQIKKDSELVNIIAKLVSDFNQGIEFQTKAVNESSEVTESIIASLKHVSEISQREKDSIKSLKENAARAQDSMQGTKQSVQNISQSVEGIGSAISIISSIAANTNLLSMNAAIEAAHAGDAGRGFAVVADEIRRLSESTRMNSVDISRTLKSIIEGINITSTQSIETEKRIAEISKEISGFAQIILDIINTFNKLSGESLEITTAFNHLKEQSAAFKTGYFQMAAATEKLAETVNEIAARRGIK
ncbi:MAG: methyl-accepting chemotaxis protein [Treponema sp.]|nr:methyl-accepting chemotaxis protein [Treponema sp.]